MDYSSVDWKKSSRCGANAQCVEIGRLGDGVVGVRDGKVPASPVLAVSAPEWNGLITAIKRGEYDLS
jgi:Domain of unknown function (DUF397)